MGSMISFSHKDSIVTVKIPSLDRVLDQQDEDAPATRGSWNGATGEVIFYYIRAVDVTTICKSEAHLPDGVLEMQPNAYELIGKDTQTRLNAIAKSASEVASSAFEYWISLLRWVTGFHRIGREVRVGRDSGWSTYLHQSGTDKPVWVKSQVLVVEGIHEVTTDEWKQLNLHAAAEAEPPMHTVLLGDARHCIDVGDYRRALIDLSVACEVYLRTVVIDSLPSGVHKEVVRLIEEANINQYVEHMFPALLTDEARKIYKRSVKEDLKSLSSRRNKLMHVAALEGATHQNCERYRQAVEALFSLDRNNA